MNGDMIGPGDIPDDAGDDDGEAGPDAGLIDVEMLLDPGAYKLGGQGLGGNTLLFNLGVNWPVFLAVGVLVYWWWSK